MAVGEEKRPRSWARKGKNETKEMDQRVQEKEKITKYLIINFSLKKKKSFY